MSYAMGFNIGSAKSHSGDPYDGITGYNLIEIWLFEHLRVLNTEFRSPRCFSFYYTCATIADMFIASCDLRGGTSVKRRFVANL